MQNDDLSSAIEPIVKLFNDLSIPYYVCGSVASSLYGISRTTQDIDLVSDISKRSIVSLVEHLKSKYFIDAGMIEEAIDSNSSFNLIHLETMIKIDVFILKDEKFHQSTNNRKILDKLNDNPDSISIYISSPEDVILSKLIWYNQSDRISERQWLDILGVFKVQNNNLDMEYLNQWAIELNLQDLLQKALSECEL